jgi:hypothetical protein
VALGPLACLLEHPGLPWAYTRSCDEAWPPPLAALELDGTLQDQLKDDSTGHGSLASGGVDSQPARVVEDQQKQLRRKRAFEGGGHLASTSLWSRPSARAHAQPIVVPQKADSQPIILRSSFARSSRPQGPKVLRSAHVTGHVDEAMAAHLRGCAACDEHAQSLIELLAP